MAVRFIKQDVERVKQKLISNYGVAIRDMKTFLRAYDVYASDSYLARSSDYIPDAEEGNVLDGSDADNFCANVAVAVFRNLKISFEAKEEKREKLAPIEEVKGEFRPYGKAERVPKVERHATKFNFVGKEKGRIVYARRIKINTRYGVQFRYIDNGGRYVGVKKK
jgi:hypothetical protein